MSKKSKAAKAAKRGTVYCAYCGASSKDVEVTDDHVIPLALYPEPKPPDNTMIVVPACRPCNEQKAKDEDYLRDWLTMNNATHGQPQAHAVFHGSVLSSVKTNRSQLARIAMSKGKQQPVYTKAGLYLGDGVEVPLEGKRLNEYFEMMAHGLYFAETNARLTDDCIFEITHISPLGIREIWQQLRDVGAQTFQIGTTGVCYVARVAASDVPQTRLYFIVFYESVGVEITTYPCEYKDYVAQKTAELVAAQEEAYGAG